MEAINSELAVAKNKRHHKPNFCWNNLVTAESPTGDKLSSPHVCKKANINQIAATLPVPERFIPMTNAPKPKPTKANAKANFTAVLGLYFPKLGHIKRNWCQQNNK
jgi:predicted TIM-barrel fold metal-dependent hydrolase